MGLKPIFFWCIESHVPGQWRHGDDKKSFVSLFAKCFGKIDFLVYEVVAILTLRERLHLANHECFKLRLKWWHSEAYSKDMPFI